MLKVTKLILRVSARYPLSWLAHLGHQNHEISSAQASAAIQGL